MTTLSNSMPRVTLVTPAYNQADFLAETIDSVLMQDYVNLEYIVLDDGSTDDTQAVLARYAGRLQFQRHENRGQAATLNRGWAMANGELLGYLSSDDKLVPGAVTALVQQLQAHPNAVVAYGDYDLIDVSGTPFRSCLTEEFNVDRLNVELVCQPGPGALFRRSAFDAVGGWSTSLRQTPDFEFWLRMARIGTFVRVPLQLAHYRVHEGSASFAVVKPERSDEIVHVMQHYWNGADHTRSRRSLAKAHLIAAKSHAQSGRYRPAAGHWAAAMKLAPRAVIAPATLRAMLSGLLRRPLYRLFGRAF
jgi:glycosyltransferase involved in cell wall biosynthesis